MMSNITGLDPDCKKSSYIVKDQDSSTRFEFCDKLFQ